MVVEALRQQACGGRQVYIMGKGERALHGTDGYAEKAGSEGKGGGSLRGEKMSGRTALFRCRRCRVLSSGRE